MFKHYIDPPKRHHETVTISLDGRAVTVPKKMSVAAALLSRGEMLSRISPSSKKPCAPHCLMGVCYECLMEIDGVNRQACMTEVAEGMVIHRHLDGAPPLEPVPLQHDRSDAHADAGVCANAGASASAGASAGAGASTEDAASTASPEKEVSHEPTR